MDDEYEFGECFLIEDLEESETRNIFRSFRKRGEMRRHGVYSPHSLTRGDAGAERIGDARARGERERVRVE